MPNHTPPEQDLLLSEFLPKPQLVTAETVITTPQFPVIDAHNHLGEDFGGGWCNRPVAELLDVLDEAGIHALVDLDGGWGEDILQQRLDTFKTAVPERFCFFGGVDWTQWPAQGDNFGEWAAQRLREQARWGAQGLKVWKHLGLHIRDQHNALVPIDDARLDPVWATAGELGLPITTHIADPVAFFNPLDATNERWEELHAHPDWAFNGPEFPPFMDLMNQFANVIRRHPNTTFIGAHLGCYAENLGWVGQLLDECPNFHVDVSARMAEIGRQPYTARRFFIKYADRILFGLDGAANVDDYRLYYRFLETADEYFNYTRYYRPTQGRWQVYGLYLPADVLAKIYHENAVRLIPGLTI
ncbi:amidohydrolase family protein [Chloroflexota bacterium]